jgi:hypothetical protein
MRSNVASPAVAVTPILLLKLLATPTIIALASLAGRRWGPGVSGWIAGIPLTSGPLALYFALEQGTGFAARAAIGTLVGLLGVAAFCAAYGRLAGCFAWPVALGASLGVFAGLSFVTHALDVVPLVALTVVVASLVLAIRLLPEPAIQERSWRWPPWDIPLRMVLATVLVITLTGLSPILGSRWSGQLSPVPIYAGLMAVFAHRNEGAAAAVEVVRGVLLGAFGFALFFCCLALMLPVVALAVAFGAATVICITAQSTALFVVSRIERRPLVTGADLTA